MNQPRPGMVKPPTGVLAPLNLISLKAQIPAVHVRILRSLFILEASRCVLSATDHDHVRDMRDAGVRGVLIYCADYRCSHSVAQSAGRWADTLRRLWDIEPRFICKARQGSLDLMSLFFSQIDCEIRTKHCRASSLSIVNHPALPTLTNQKSRLKRVVTHRNKTPKSARKKHWEQHALDRRSAH